MKRLKSAGFSDADIFQVKIRCYAFFSDERSGEGGSAEARTAAEVFETDARGIILFHEAAGFSDFFPVFPVSAGRIRQHAPADERREKSFKIFSSAVFSGIFHDILVECQK